MTQYGRFSNIFGRKANLTVAYALFTVGCLLWRVRAIPRTPNPCTYIDSHGVVEPVFPTGRFSWGEPLLVLEVPA